MITKRRQMMKDNKPFNAKRPSRKKRALRKARKKAEAKWPPRKASNQNSQSVPDSTDRISDREQSIKRMIKKRKLTRKPEVLTGMSDGVSPSRTSAWISPDGVYCNTAYAANYVGRSISRLQSWRCEGIGPKYIKNGYSVFYRTADITAFMENG